MNVELPSGTASLLFSDIELYVRAGRAQSVESALEIAMRATQG